MIRKSLNADYASWPRIVEAAAEAHEPHRVAYLSELASHFIATEPEKDEPELRFIIEDDPEVTVARFAQTRNTNCSSERISDFWNLPVADAVMPVGLDPLERELAEIEQDQSDWDA